MQDFEKSISKINNNLAEDVRIEFYVSGNDSSEPGLHVYVKSQKYTGLNWSHIGFDTLLKAFFEGKDFQTFLKDLTGTELDKFQSTLNQIIGFAIKNGSVIEETEVIGKEQL